MPSTSCAAPGAQNLRKDSWGTYTYGYLFSRAKTGVKADVVFATFQTMVNKRTLFSPEHFKYVVIDEVHHAQAETFRPTVLYFTPKYMFGLTATLQRSDGLNVKELFGGHEPVFNLGLPLALARRLACDVDYRIMVDDIDYDRLLGVAVGSMGVSGLNRTIFVPKRDQEIVRLIRERTAHIAKPRILVFCASRRHANAIAKHLPGAICVHSGFSAKVNDDQLASFKSGESSTAVTVDMFNEGVDVPEVNVIVFLRSVLWYGLFLQQLGRGVRLADGKDELLVLDFVGNCERIEMIELLRKEVEQARSAIAQSGKSDDRDRTSREPFFVRVGGVEFAERGVKILSLIKRIRDGNSVESLAAMLREKALELERSPYAHEVNDDPAMPAARVFNRAFGKRTWDGVLIANELKPFALGELTKDELIVRMRDYANEIGRTPTCDEIDVAPGFPSVKAMLKIFKVSTWNELVVACGLRVRRVADQTDAQRKAQLAAELLAKADVLGRAPKMVELDADPNMANSATYSKVFGKPYRGVLAELGLLKYTPAKLAAGLRELHARTGKMPTTWDVDENPALPSPATYCRVFGARGWAEVLEKAWQLKDPEV